MLGKKITTAYYEINDPKILLLLTVSHLFPPDKLPGVGADNL